MMIQDWDRYFSSLIGDELLQFRDWPSRLS